MNDYVEGVDSVRAYFPARISLDDGTEVEVPTILHSDGTVSIELGEHAGQKFTFLGYSLGIQESSNWVMPQEYQRNGGPECPPRKKSDGPWYRSLEKRNHRK